MGLLNGFKAGQRARRSLPLKLQVANGWPGLLHVTGLSLPPWSHGGRSQGDHLGRVAQQVLEVENVGCKTLGVEECGWSQLSEPSVVKTWECRSGGQSGHSYGNKYLLSTYYIPGTVLDAGVKAMHKIGKVPGPRGPGSSPLTQ